MMLHRSAGPANETDDSDLSPETMASVVYEKLRADILGGKLQPGERLRIETLKERYGVGASPMREALNRLSAGSFVKRFDQRGFQVAPVSMVELLELTRTRCLLNEIALRESIANGDTAWEDQIILTCNRLSRTEGLLPDGEVNPLWEERHRRFHMALIAACGSHWLLELSESLFDCADRYRNLAMQSAPNDRNTVDEHKAIMEAVLDRKSDVAVRLLNEHISKTAQTISLTSLATDEGAGGAEAAETPKARKRSA
jgi:GntR family carbon starvation induced transcriptional regulator